MSGDPRRSFEFGDYHLDPAERLLFRAGRPVPLPPKAIDTLLALLERHGHLVPKDELMQRVWPDTFVEEANLTQNISLLRKALGDAAESGGHRFIETIPRRGYRFVAPVVLRDHESPSLLVHDATWAPPARTWAVLAAVLAIGAASAGALVWLTSTHAAVRPVPTVRTLAILPLKSLGPPDGGDRYLGLGLADTLIAGLSTLPDLIVRPTGAVRGYVDPGLDPLRAGRDLRADAVLDGTYHTAGPRVRVNVRLLRVDDGVTLWSGTFDEDAGDILRLQSALARDVVTSLALQLDPERAKALVPHQTRDVEAYRLYLQGRYLWEKRTDESLRMALDYFQRAVDRDPLYPWGYVGIADTYILMSNLDVLPPDEAQPRAKAAARRALDIFPEFPEALTCLAMVSRSYDWDRDTADQQFRRAIRLNPNYATAHHWYGLHLASAGQFDRALTEIRSAQQLDPLSMGVLTSEAWVLYLARRYDEAETRARKALETDGAYRRANWVLGEVLMQTGRLPQALAAFETAGHRAPIARARARLGDAASARETLRALAREATNRYVAPANVAGVHVALGDPDAALEWLERAYEERESALTYLAVEPSLDPLRSHPRFTDLLRRVARPESRSTAAATGAR